MRMPSTIKITYKKAGWQKLLICTKVRQLTLNLNSIYLNNTPLGQDAEFIYNTPF